jgi:hypothetical protein
VDHGTAEAVPFRFRITLLIKLNRWCLRLSHARA